VRRLAVILLCGLAATITVGIVAFGSSAAPARPTYFQDVKPILDSRCAGCHYAGGIAPFKLTGYLDAFRHREAVAEAVRSRKMPPWHADSRARRYLYDPSLTNEQISTLVRWAGRRGPRGDASRPGAALPSVSPRLSRVDVRVPMQQAYRPQRRTGGDDYRCFVLPWVPDRATHVTGFNLRPGQRRQVHHIIVYLATPENARTLASWERQDRGPGYECYGGPSATGQQSFGFQFLSGWVPGSFGTDFAAGTGIRLAPGSRLVMQIHYNLEAVDAVRPDRSVVELKLDETVERRAVYAPLVDAGWILSPRSFRIPARRNRIPHSFVADPRELFRITSGMDFSRGFVIHSLLLHMHRLGRNGSVTLERAAGGREVLLRLPRWDFNWQREYHLASSAAFAPGDRLALRCEHANPTRQLKTWGENSSDEMCIAFLYVSEP
jgi:Copper type II ascorbate-dependent monooxygenase, C-terminal domain